MIKAKRIMILGASILQLPAILKAKDMGLEVIAVDFDSNAVGFKYADINLVISTNDIENVLKKAKELDIDGIMTLASDMPMRTVATVSTKLKLTGISVESAMNTTDKALMRRAMQKAGVPIPHFVVEDYNTFLQKSKSFNSKFIVKPTDSSGSRGIYLIENPNDEQALSNAYDYSRRYSKSGLIILEEYMEGPEVSVEALTYNGATHVLAITDKVTTGSPRFVEMGHSQPSTLNEEQQKQIESITKRAVKAVGIDFGPTHTEVIVTNNGPKIVEIGARMGGDNITTHLVPLSTGIDMVGACINIALGLPPDISRRTNFGSAIRYLRVKSGVIKSINGIEEAKAIDGIKDIYINKVVGEKVDEILNSTNRIGYVIAQGDNASHAISICEKAFSKIKITVE